MKRSDMIIEIVDLFNRSKNLNVFKADLQDDKLAEEILELIEKLGMLPPETNPFYWKESSGYHDLIHKWEPEN